MYQPCVRRATAALAKDGAAALGTRHCPTSRRKANAAPAQHRIVVRHDRERQRSYECRARRGGCGCYDASAAPRKFADRDGSNSGIGSVVDLCHLRGAARPNCCRHRRSVAECRIIGRPLDGESNLGWPSPLSKRVHAFDCEWYVLFFVGGMPKALHWLNPRSEGTRSEMDRWPVLRGLGGCRTRGAELNPVRPTP